MSGQEREAADALLFFYRSPSLKPTAVAPPTIPALDLNISSDGRRRLSMLTAAAAANINSGNTSGANMINKNHLNALITALEEPLSSPASLNSKSRRHRSQTISLSRAHANGNVRKHRRLSVESSISTHSEPNPSRKHLKTNPRQMVQRQRSKTISYSLSMVAPKTPRRVRIGSYTPEERQKRIEVYLSKRRSRIWTKQIKYNVRKTFADSRLRVKGRFISKEDEGRLREMIMLCT